MKTAKCCLYFAAAAALLVSAMLSGCSSNPISSDLRRQAQQITISQVRADPENTRGSMVVWGGRILNVVNGTNGGAIYIVCFPIRSNGRPVGDGPSPGRFIATSADFLEPETFPEGSLITVAGQLDGVWTEQLDEMEYRYPVVDARQIHVWLEQSDQSSSAAFVTYTRPPPVVYWAPPPPIWWYGPPVVYRGWGPGPRPGFRGGFHAGVTVSGGPRRGPGPRRRRGGW